jgi:TrmH family RNA methyltransferase
VCVLEGPDLVAAALETNQQFEAVYVDADAVDDVRYRGVLELAESRGVRIFLLAPGVVEKVADATTPQPVLAAVRFPTLSHSPVATRGLTLILHDVRDPGNAGTVIRSADAAGADAVYLTGESVDPYNPKTIRATAGSLFHVPVLVGGLSDVVGQVRDRGANVWAAVVRGGVDYTDAALAGPVAVVVGNESDGLDADALALCDDRLSIPMAGRSESLNLGVAASLVAFEALRQRRSAAGQSPRPSLEGS